MAGLVKRRHPWIPFKGFTNSPGPTLCSQQAFQGCDIAIWHDSSLWGIQFSFADPHKIQILARAACSPSSGQVTWTDSHILLTHGLVIMLTSYSCCFLSPSWAYLPITFFNHSLIMCGFPWQYVDPSSTWLATPANSEITDFFFCYPQNRILAKLGTLETSLWKRSTYSSFLLNHGPG